MAAAHGPPGITMGRWREATDKYGVTSNAQADADRDRLDFAVLMGCDNGSGKKIRAVKDFPTFFNHLMSLPNAERNLYAVSHPDEKTKLSFDLEYECAKEKHKQAWGRVAGAGAPPPTPEVFLRRFLDDLRAFLTELNFALDLRRLAVTVAHNEPEKISFHLICLDFWVDGRDRARLYGSTSSGRPTGMIMTNTHLGKWHPCLDNTIGSSFRHFRTIHSTKLFQKRWLKPCDRLAELVFFSSDSPLDTFLAHTWTWVPEDCSRQIVVPAAGVKRPAPASHARTAPRANTRADPRGMELLYLLGIDDKFKNIRQVQLDREQHPSTLAAYRARMVGGPCPWCDKKDGHNNNFFFPVSIVDAELSVFAYKCGGDACVGGKKLEFDKERHAEARDKFLTQQSERDLQPLVSDEDRQARQTVRNHVANKMKIHPEPGRVWAPPSFREDERVARE